MKWDVFSFSNEFELSKEGKELRWIFLDQDLFYVVEGSWISLKVKRLGEGGTQTFDIDILPENAEEIKGSVLK